MLAIQLEFRRKSVQNKVKIQFADNADVAAGRGRHVQSRITTRLRCLGSSGLKPFFKPVWKASN